MSISKNNYNNNDTLYNSLKVGLQHSWQAWLYILKYRNEMKKEYTNYYLCIGFHLPIREQTELANIMTIYQLFLYEKEPLTT